MGRRKKRGRKKKKGTPWLRPWLRMIGISLIFGSGLFALALGMERVTASPSFKVERVTWYGLAHLNAEEMTQRFQSELGKNIFKVDIVEMHRRLIAERWIKSATVKKDFPNRLTIFVVERKPASVEYRLHEQGDPWVNLSVAPVLIDKEGVILQQGGPFPPGLARLIHVNAKAYDKALRLWSQLDKAPGVFIDLADPEDLVVYLTETAEGKLLGRLHLGNDGFAERWTRFVAIENHLRRRGLSPWEVDLRFPGQVIVKNRQGKVKPVSGAPPESIYF